MKTIITKNIQNHLNKINNWLQMTHLIHNRTIRIITRLCGIRKPKLPKGIFQELLNDIKFFKNLALLQPNIPHLPIVLDNLHHTEEIIKASHYNGFSFRLYRLLQRQQQ